MSRRVVQREGAQHKFIDINRFITENRLRFLGFSIDESVVHLFRKRFPDNPAADDLPAWQLFEEENPATFIRCINSGFRSSGNVFIM